MKYLPEEEVKPKNLNKLALMGASFESLGKKYSVSVKKFNRQLQEKLGNNFSVEAFDVDKNNKIDIAENAVSFLLKDMLKSDETLSRNNIDGTYTHTEDINSLMFLRKDMLKESSRVASQVYNDFELDEAAKDFKTENKPGWKKLLDFFF